MEVTLEQILAARDTRAARQSRLNQLWHKPLISFTMNIPGPVKCSPTILRGFRQGCCLLEAELPAGSILHREVTEATTGCEAIYVVALPAAAVKAITAQIEDTHGLGRLFDMDVLDETLHKLDRALVGGGQRNCIVCGAPGRDCAARRVHSLESLQGAVQTILRTHFAREDAAWIGSAAAKSLADEALTTPKPGLVDQRNTGSHRDMDLNVFLRSARILEPYFYQCACLGMDTARLSPEETFAALRQAGIQAEKEMFAATNGVNTHKGAIFTMGILCGALGRLWKPEGGWDLPQISAEISAMTRSAMESDYVNQLPDTAGKQLFNAYGIQGIRGEVAMGLPTVMNTGLPTYRRYLGQNLPPMEAGALTLLHLLLQAEDTCLIHRGGLAGAQQAVERTAQLLDREHIPTRKELEALDNWFIQRNLSCGGCADLLAAVYFLDTMTQAAV